jgi:hypothetical protein
MLRLLSPLFAHHAGQQVNMLLLPYVVSYCCLYNAGQLLPRGAAVGYIPAAPRCIGSSRTQRGAAVAYIPDVYNTAQQVYMLLLPYVVSHCFPYNAGQLLPRGAAVGYIPAALRCVYICYILLLRFLSPLLAHHAGQQVYTSRICIYILYICICV